MPEKLHNTDFLLQNLMNNMPDAIYFKDRQSRFIIVNQACADKHGWESVEAVKGQSDFDVFSAAHAEQAFADEQRIIETGEPLFGIEEKETWPDGRVTWVSTTKMPLKNDAGEIIGTFGVSRDITDHKEAELRAAYYDEQVRRIKERMEENVRFASDLQKTFFPRSYPFFRAAGESNEGAVQFLHHCQASGIVSGDFCAVHRLSDTEAGIFLCDVMGHGVRAALGTALICAMVEEVSALEKDPGKYLGRMNALLLPILRQEDIFLYATACYMVFDASSGTLRFANAGHPVPLHFPPGEDSAQWLMDDFSLRGPALAIAEGAEYQTMERTIQPGSTVVMYTDGLYEMESPDGEEFGEDRLLSTAVRAGGLPLEKLFPALTDAAAGFAGGGEFNDDVCLVGFTFHNPMEEKYHGF
jgi:sigma-B regulation protein RsbU (phosphoserine phosphatase)